MQKSHSLFKWCFSKIHSFIHWLVRFCCCCFFFFNQIRTGKLLEKKEKKKTCTRSERTIIGISRNRRVFRAFSRLTSHGDSSELPVEGRRSVSRGIVSPYSSDCPLNLRLFCLLTPLCFLFQLGSCFCCFFTHAFRFFYSENALRYLLAVTDDEDTANYA